LIRAPGESSARTTTCAADFFGPKGDTNWNLARLKSVTKNFQHTNLGHRDRAAVIESSRTSSRTSSFTAAAQPSHDLAASRPFDDFDVNAVGTLNLLEATRKVRDQNLCDPVFVFMSTTKFTAMSPTNYGSKSCPRDGIIRVRKTSTAWREDMRITAVCHSLFGASKVAADVICQEYGRYFGMKTGTFRGGCLTGQTTAASSWHGFLNYLFKVAKAGGQYTIFGYKGKQVRDNIHSFDVISAFEAFYRNPRPGEVYNLGGCRENSCSMLEAPRDPASR